MTKIGQFDGKYAFLSNFYTTPVVYENIPYPSSEAAFQAAKCLDPDDRRAFTTVNPGKAKRMGRQVALRPDWDEIRDQVMYDIVKDKFTRNRDLAQALLATGDAYLEEGTYWHDRYWGVCTCNRCRGQGLNKLGQILMRVRNELRTEQNKKRG